MWKLLPELSKGSILGKTQTAVSFPPFFGAQPRVWAAVSTLEFTSPPLPQNSDLSKFEIVLALVDCLV